MNMHTCQELNAVQIIESKSILHNKIDIEIDIMNTLALLVLVRNLPKDKNQKVRKQKSYKKKKFSDHKSKAPKTLRTTSRSQT